MIVISYGGHNINDGNNYQAYLISPGALSLPDTPAVMVLREGRHPVVSTIERQGRVLLLEVSIVAATGTASLRAQLFSWFDSDDETPKSLIVADNGGGNDRYVMAICERLYEAREESGLIFRVQLRVDGDVRWRKVAVRSGSVLVTSGLFPFSIDNDGDDVAYPVLTITPNAAKTGSSYAYKRWLPVRWRVSEGASNYPVDVVNASFDTATLVAGGKMQADGDDLRITVNGLEVDRWLNGIASATTSVWVNLNFVAMQENTLSIAIGATGSVTEVAVAEEIDGFPESGVVVIDGEAFAYTNRDTVGWRFLGVTRAVNGTSMASHSVGATVWWVQNDVWCLYGNSSATAPTVDDLRKPVFALASSSNTSWDYDEFGEDSGLRAGSWSREPSQGVPVFYGGNQGASTDPWVEVGLKLTSPTGVPLTISGQLGVYNPCGITNANFQNGEKRQESVADSWFAAIYSWRRGGTIGNTEFIVAVPTVMATWQAWSQNEVLDSNSIKVALYLYGRVRSALSGNYLECSRVTLTLDPSYTPTVTVGGEQSVYALDCVIETVDSGDELGVQFNMAIGQSIEVNTDDKTVTYLVDNSGQFQAVALNTTRRDWLRLLPGTNSMAFREGGLVSVTLAWEFEERFYD